MVFRSVCLLALSAVAANAETALPFLPPGVASGLEGERLQAEPLTLALHPPQEDEKVINDELDAFLKVEQLAEKAADADALAQKQRLLNAELARVHDLAGRSSFLKQKFPGAGAFGDILGGSDYEIRLHPAEETAAEVSSSLESLLRVENAKAASATADFIADKKRLLQAEIAKIHHLLA